MNLDAEIKKLFEKSQFKGMKFDLERFRDICACFGCPQNSFKSVHIAGTNGKGSVSLKIASSLQLEGYKVGLYTSPHIATFRERIKVNGLLIEEARAKVLLNEIFQKEENLTFFETLTLLSFLYFQEEKVDFAVYEVGLGGRLDATNLITPLVSVITSISMDHIQILGNSLESIAFEKAGIIKPGVPVVLGSKLKNLELLSKIAENKKAPLIYAHSATSSFYDAENSESAKCALELLGVQEPKGLHMRPSCRFEEVNGVILDVAHNPDGIKRCLEAFKLYFPDKPLNVLMGISYDKDVENALLLLAEYVDTICFISGSTPRSMSPITLLRMWHSLSSKPATACNSSQEAFQNHGITLVLGSFYIMQEVRNILGVSEPWDNVGLYESAVHEVPVADLSIGGG